MLMWMKLLKFSNTFDMMLNWLFMRDSCSFIAWETKLNMLVGLSTLLALPRTPLPLLLPLLSYLRYCLSGRSCCLYGLSCLSCLSCRYTLSGRRYSWGLGCGLLTLVGCLVCSLWVLVSVLEGWSLCFILWSFKILACWAAFLIRCKFACLAYSLSLS